MARFPFADDEMTTARWDFGVYYPYEARRLTGKYQASGGTIGSAKGLPDYDLSQTAPVRVSVPWSMALDPRQPALSRSNARVKL